MLAFPLLRRRTGLPPAPPPAARRTAPVLRNALLRLPTNVLVLASLGFLGLGEQPPTAQWGRLLSENQPYAELAPWTVLGPVSALVLLSVLALSGTDAATVRSRASARVPMSRRSH